MNTLGIGSRGQEVINLQEALNYQLPAASPALAVDGIFGPKTQARLRAFQSVRGLAVDAYYALHRDGNSFVYVSRLFRLTTGVRLELGPHVVLKAEYTLIRELGRIPQFDDDVFTSSLSVRL